MYCKMPVNPPDDLTLAYTPGVAAAFREVLKDPLTAYGSFYWKIIRLW